MKVLLCQLRSYSARLSGRKCPPKSVINLHIKSEKHSQGKACLQSMNKREQDIAMALQKYDEEVHPVGETLPAQQRVYRVKVVSSFLKAGN